MSRTVGFEQLKKHCSALLQKAGAMPAHADITAQCLVDADLCGVDTHGVSRMETYVKRLLSGGVNVKGEFSVCCKYGGGALCDGGGALGQVTSVKAMELAMENAVTAGCYTVFVKNSSHYGMASYYTRMASERGLVAMTATNAPPALAPWGSHQAYFGPNPLAIAIPGRHGTAISLDMAPSAVPRGKLMLAIQKGESIPTGWALDPQGNPTTDPQLGWDGTLLPIGGPKGAGLAMCLDILCGMTSGAAFGPYIGNLFAQTDRLQNVGHTFTVIDPGMFAGRDSFYDDVDKMLADIRSLPKNPGVDRIYAPGEIEMERRTQRMAEGIPLPDGLYAALTAMAREMESEVFI